jgi:hypothetical protein
MQASQPMSNTLGIFDLASQISKGAWRRTISCNVFSRPDRINPHCLAFPNDHGQVIAGATGVDSVISDVAGGSFDKKGFSMKGYQIAVFNLAIPLTDHSKNSPFEAILRINSVPLNCNCSQIYPQLQCHTFCLKIAI